MKTRLFTPGPTPVPEDVTLAMSAPMPHHRTPEFQELMLRTTRKLQDIYRTDDPVVLLSSSGTGAMEAAVVNLTSPGETCLAVRGGKFGERWTELLQVYGRSLHAVDVAWGQPITPEDLDRELEASGATTAFVTHSETSTATACDLQQIAKVARERGAMLIVDAITSLGAHRLETKEWELDCVVGGSQKAFMMPPGLAFLSLSDRARRKLANNDTPRFYFDLGKALKGVDKGQSPWTPAITLVMGLERACDRMLAETMPVVWRRHRLLADAVRAGVQALGLEQVSVRPSNAVTAVYIPDEIGADNVRARLWQRFGMKLAGGQGHLVGKIIRLGHLGCFDAADMILQLEAFEETLVELGFEAKVGTAIGAARPILKKLDEAKS